MIQQQALFLRSHDNETGADSVNQNVTGVFRRKAGEKPFTRAHRVKSADAFKTFAHGKDAESNKRLGIALLGSVECYRAA